MILFNIKRINDIDIEKFCMFLISQLNLPTPLVYKEKQFGVLDKKKQSVYNIVFNWFFDLSKDRTLNNAVNNSTYIENLLENIKTSSKLKVDTYKKASFYKEAFLLDQLTTLNETFEVKLIGSFLMQNLKYPENFDYTFVFKEKRLINTIKLAKEKFKENFLLKEKDLENYLKYHLDLIEDGMKFISTQEKIENGVLDILAVDKEGITTIIELKTARDERIVWQALYYPIEYKKEHNKKDIRMIVISTDLDNSILEPLKLIKGLEIFKAKIFAKDNKIIDVTLTKK